MTQRELSDWRKSADAVCRCGSLFAIVAEQAEDYLHSCPLLLILT